MTDHHLDAFVESPVRGNAHAGFGGRRRGNHRPQGRHGASPPTRLLGFSYGFRPGRSPHDALDALAVGIKRRKVNWVLDADIRDFFTGLDQSWLERFLEHRIAARRRSCLQMPGFKHPLTA